MTLLLYPFSEIIGVLQYSTFHAIRSDYDKSVILQVTKLYSEYQNVCVTTGMACKCKIKRQDYLMSPATELKTSREVLKKMNSILTQCCNEEKVQMQTLSMLKYFAFLQHKESKMFKYKCQCQVVLFTASHLSTARRTVNE